MKTKLSSPNYYAGKLPYTEWMGKEVNITYGDKSEGASSRGYEHPFTLPDWVLYGSGAAQCGHRGVIVRTSDTGVVALLISSLNSIPAEKIRVSLQLRSTPATPQCMKLQQDLVYKTPRCWQCFMPLLAYVSSFFAGKVSLGYIEKILQMPPMLP